MTKARPHLLLVDDEASIRDPLGKYLERQGFRVTDAADASIARSSLLTYDIDLVLLDIMMPGEDGLSLCRNIAANNGPPVILLTAKSEETDRIVGLEIVPMITSSNPFLLASWSHESRLCYAGSHRVSRKTAATAIAIISADGRLTLASKACTTPIAFSYRCHQASTGCWRRWSNVPGKC